VGTDQVRNLGARVTSRTLDKKFKKFSLRMLMRRCFLKSRKTKARIMRKETTVPKVPDDPNAQEEKDTVMEENGGKQDASEQDEDQSSDNDDSGDDDTPAEANGKPNSKAPGTSSSSSHAETGLRIKYQSILDTRLTEIKGVFDNGMSENIHR
jgi:hypothetical protein